MKFLLALLLLVSCSHVPQLSVVPENNVQQTLDVVKEAQKTHLTITKLEGFSSKQEERFRKLVLCAEKIVNSPEFKEKVLNFSYNKKNQFVSTTDSNETVLKNVLSKDWPIYYKLQAIRKVPFRPWTKGYTYPNVDWVIMNSLLYDGWDDSDILQNIVHEVGGHKIGGYNHDKQHNAARPSSVPYALGTISSDLMAIYCK